MAVINKYHHNNSVPDGAVDIMRGTVFGNPFPVSESCSREEAVAAFRVWLWKKLKADPGYADLVKNLHGKDLCCCCAPKLCHGDVLERAAAWLNEERI